MAAELEQHWATKTILPTSTEHVGKTFCLLTFYLLQLRCWPLQYTLQISKSLEEEKKEKLSDASKDITGHLGENISPSSLQDAKQTAIAELNIREPQKSTFPNSRLQVVLKPAFLPFFNNQVNKVSLIFLITSNNQNLWSQMFRNCHIKKSPFSSYYDSYMIHVHTRAYSSYHVHTVHTWYELCYLLNLFISKSTVSSKRDCWAHLKESSKQMKLLLKQKQLNLF